MGRTTLMMAAATTALGIFFSTLVAWKFHLSEKAALTREFRNDVETLALALERHLQRNMEVLYGFEMLFENSAQVTAVEFRHAAADAQARHPDLQALYWFTEGAADVASPSVTYAVRNADFATPYSSALTSGSDVYRLLREAGSSGGLVARAASPAAAGGERTLLVAALPVYRGQPAIAGDKVQPLGTILGVFDLESAMLQTFNQQLTGDISLILSDLSTAAAKQVLFRRLATETPTGDSSFACGIILAPIDGREWELSAIPSKSYLNRQLSLLPLLVFFSGTGLFCLATGLFLVVLRHSRIVSRMVEARTRDLNRANEQLEHLSRTDKLTDVSNRRFFDETLEREWKRAVRSQQPLAVIMVDIDHFKRFNDSYGHIEGDRCLRAVARCLKDKLKRPGDLVARFGGEEFACVLPHSDEKGLAVAEELRREVENLGIASPCRESGGVVTISAGFATTVPDAKIVPGDLLRAADAALYRAKKNGRNRVESAPAGKLSPLTLLREASPAAEKK